MKKKIVIIDLGSSRIKAGTLEDKLPSVIIPILNPNTLNSPIKNGIIIDWYAIKKYFEQVIEELKINPIEYKLSLSICDTSPQKSDIYQFIFSHFEFSKIYIGPQTIQSLYIISRVTGLVCNLGYDMIQIIPIYQGYNINHLNKKIHLSGRLIEELTNIKLFSNSNNKALNNSLNYSDLKTDQIDKMLDVLFNPKKFNLDCDSFSEEIDNIVKSADLTIRLDLMQNIVLIGGISLITEIEDKINNSLQKINKRYTPVIIEKNRQVYEWLGNQKLCKLDIFDSFLIEKSNYKLKLL